MNSHSLPPEISTLLGITEVDGYLIEWMVTLLDRPFAGGGPGSHALVSVRVPGCDAFRGYAFMLDGYLDLLYLAEKLDLDPADRHNVVRAATAVTAGLSAIGGNRELPNEEAVSDYLNGRP